MIPFKLKRVEPKAIRKPISPFRCSVRNQNVPMIPKNILNSNCLLYTSDAADD